MQAVRRMGGKGEAGFTLLELIVVFALLSVIAVVSLRGKVQDAADVQARAVGQQLREVGVDAVRAYIAKNYLALVSDPNGFGTITLGQLQGDGFLPTTFSGTNPWGVGYAIQWKRTGVLGNYNIEALTTLTDRFAAVGDTTIDPTGEALAVVGAEGGLTECGANPANLYDDASCGSFVFNGLRGSFAETGVTTQTATNFSNVNRLRQLGAKVTYQTSQFDEFIRRDGSRPMAGALDAGNQNINNANLVSANTVDIDPTGDINFGPRARKLSWLMPRFVEMEAYYVNDGQTIPKPTCDTGGQAAAVLNPISTRAQFYINPAYVPANDPFSAPGAYAREIIEAGTYHTRLYVEVVGTDWVARVKGWDLTTSADGGGGFPGSAFARTYCYYP